MLVIINSIAFVAMKNVAGYLYTQEEPIVSIVSSLMPFVALASVIFTVLILILLVS